MAESPQNIGYITVTEHERLFYGGLLVVNSMGRPVEFHCTSPVRPSKPNEILFGSTLRSYVMGDLVSSKLANCVKQKPALFCFTQSEMLNSEFASENRSVFIPSEFTQLHSNQNEPNIEVEKRDSLKVHVPETVQPSDADPFYEFEVSGIKLLASTDWKNEKRNFATLLTELASSIALDEPFERVVNAMSQSHKIVLKQAS